MKQEGLKYLTNIDLQLVALILFVVVFAGMIFTIFSKSRRALYSEIEKLPLQEDLGDKHT